MAELKTKKTDMNAEAFIGSVADEGKRDDCRTIVSMMAKVTKSPPVMWGPSIVGFGDYRYVYASGREGDWFVMGFSPRKQKLTIYLTEGFEHHADLLSELGKFTTGMGCLYVKRLGDIDINVLEKLLAASAKRLMKK
ncbi:MAG: DUF1801 domain-containing protein ['Candidatus Kapabacteria' thiocyanatum]|uniref:YdhG-like domain-containing protein n=1 Tax=Candidatus Kapaibacterium thiocyanatum TaxID=1895771 RepID=A0A1M3KY14_9BACT|nr:DUF1801 domain-containing protein ['Candidatus Kapabacteria' thiocyanatum]OJX57119.1 MAG: hypothetical protein BGO89_11485 ['Candidatus Kapabacteria' thiocyanatum]